MKLDSVEIRVRLTRLQEVIDWVLTDVTSSIDEKFQASTDSNVISAYQTMNSLGTLDRHDLESANRLWDYYTSNLTGSNVPQRLRQMIDI